MNRSETSPRDLNAISNEVNPNSHRKRLPGIASLSSVPAFMLLPNSIKEGNIFTTLEWDVLRGGITLLAIGGLLMNEASRRRQMEAATPSDRKLSKIGMGIKVAGTSALLYVLWNLDKI